MATRKMSLIQTSKSQTKHQLDTIINADYHLLKHSPVKEKDILQCQIVRRTPLIKKYIEELEIQYNIPSPLKQSKVISSSRHSNKKLELSLRNSTQKPLDHPKQSNNRKRLSLVSSMKKGTDSNLQMNPQKLVQSRYVEHHVPLTTPKFGIYQSHHPHQLNIKIGGNQVQRQTVMERDQSQRVNFIGSKEKPIFNSQTNFINHPQVRVPNNYQQSSEYESSQRDIVELSLYVHQRQTPEKKTVKKHRKQEDTNLKSQSSLSQGNSSYTIHHNPLSSKKISKGKDERPKIEIQDSFRYCVGCEHPILSANTKQHEKSCKQFKEMCFLPQQELIRRMRQKVSTIEQKIQDKNIELNPEQIQMLKTHSNSLVRQSRSRGKAQPESPRFRQNYNNVMSLGTKWCSALQEINKLRWFTRILYKLQEIS